MRAALRTLTISLVALFTFAVLAPAAHAEPDPATVSGVLTSSATGEALQGAVRLMSADGRSVGTVVSAPDGSFVFSDVSPGVYTLQHVVDTATAYANPYPAQYLGGAASQAAAEMFTVEGSASRTIPFSLARGIRLSGDVTDAGAQVRDYSISVMRDGHSVWLTTNSDRASFETPWLLPGVYSVRVDAGDDWLVASRAVDASAGDDVAISVPLTRAATLTIDLWDDSSAVAHRLTFGTVNVRLVNADAPEEIVAQGTAVPGLAREDPHSIVLGRLPAGDYLLHFRPGWDSYLIEEWWPDAGTAAEAITLQIATGEHRTIDAQVTIGSTLYGYASYHAGAYYSEPAPRTTVRVFEQAPNGELVELEHSPVLSDAESRWQYPVPLREGEYTVTLRNEELAGIYPTRHLRSGSGEARFVTLLPTRSERLDMRLAFAEFDFERIWGSSRWHTAAAVSRELRPQPASNAHVYLANGLMFPDALSAGPAAASNDAVILTTKRDRLPEVIRSEIERLDPARITIVGGTEAVGTDVENELHEFTTAQIERIAGASRYETSRALTARAFADAPLDVVLIATGRTFPDALAAGPAASFLDAPVLLVDGNRASIDDATRALLETLAPKQILIVGEASAISTGIEDDLNNLAPETSVLRIGGENRWATAAAINTAVFPAADQSLLVSGVGFADAVVGAPLAAALQAPIQLTKRNCVPEAIIHSTITLDADHFVIIGGEAVVDHNPGIGYACSGVYRENTWDLDLRGLL